MLEEGTRSMAGPGYPRCIGRAVSPLWIAVQGVYLPAVSTRQGSLTTPAHATSHSGQVVGAPQEGECSLQGMLHAAFLLGQVIWAQLAGTPPWVAIQGVLQPADILRQGSFITPTHAFVPPGPGGVPV
jgi:hypothetical protein